MKEEHNTPLNMQDEIERMRPVYEAAVAYGRLRMQGNELSAQLDPPNPTSPELLELIESSCEVIDEAHKALYEVLKTHLSGGALSEPCEWTDPGTPAGPSRESDALRALRELTAAITARDDAQRNQKNITERWTAIGRHLNFDGDTLRMEADLVKATDNCYVNACVHYEAVLSKALQIVAECGHLKNNADSESPEASLATLNGSDA